MSLSGRHSIIFLTGFVSCLSTAFGTVSIMLDYGSTSAEDIVSYGEAFAAAETFWESNLTGYRDPVGSTPDNVTISVDLSYIDGLFNVLGSAGPSSVNTQGNFMETVAGGMTFDTADLDFMVANGTFEAVIRHEMGHVLGFGVLWDAAAISDDTDIPATFQQLYTNGSGQYTGVAALAAYQVEFGQFEATFIPVELDGGAGTKDGHWNEVTDHFSIENLTGFDTDPGDGEAAPTIVGGINAGETMDDDLMSGVLSGSTYLSNTTLASFYDLGYTIEALTPVPEPQTFTALSGLLALFYSASRRRKNRLN